MVDHIETMYFIVLLFFLLGGNLMQAVSTKIAQYIAVNV